MTLATHAVGRLEARVLARLPEPNEAQKAIAERQAAINADDETLSGLEDHFRQCLERVGYNTDSTPFTFRTGWPASGTSKRQANA